MDYDRNRLWIDKGLNITHKSLLPAVDRYMLSKYGPNWIAQYAPQGESHRSKSANITDLDPLQIFKTIWNNWENVFRNINNAERNTRSWIGELIDARNRWAHNRSSNRFTTDEVQRILDSAIKVLEWLNLPEAKEVVTLRQEVLKVFIEEEGLVTPKPITISDSVPPLEALPNITETDKSPEEIKPDRHEYLEEPLIDNEHHLGLLWPIAVDDTGTNGIDPLSEELRSSPEQSQNGSTQVLPDPITDKAEEDCIQNDGISVSGTIPQDISNSIDSSSAQSFGETSNSLVEIQVVDNETSEHKTEPLKRRVPPTQTKQSFSKALSKTLKRILPPPPLTINNLADAIQEQLDLAAQTNGEIPNFYKIAISEKDFVEWNEINKIPLRLLICDHIRIAKFHIRYSPYIEFSIDSEILPGTFENTPKKISCSIIDTARNNLASRPEIVMVNWASSDFVELRIELPEEGVVYLGRRGGDAGVIQLTQKDCIGTPIPDIDEFGGISRMHARIIGRNGQWFLQDGWINSGRGSTSLYGTFLQGEKLGKGEEKLLASGSLIGFGLRANKGDRPTEHHWESRKGKGCTFVFVR